MSAFHGFLVSFDRESRMFERGFRLTQIILGKLFADPELRCHLQRGDRLGNFPHA